MDEFRARMCNDPASQSNSSAARKQLLDMLRHRLRNRVTTVVDSTNLRSDQRAELLGIASEYGTPAIALVFTASAEWCRKRIDNRASIIRDAVLAQNADLLEQTLRCIDDEGHFAVFRLNNERAESIMFEHAFPDNSDPDRWFEVELMRPHAWVFRHPADELWRHPAVLAEIRPTWDFIARVAADMAFGARTAPTNTQVRTRVGAELRIRLPHCLPIHLVARHTGWERTPPHAR
jgi:predicted kinase